MPGRGGISHANNSVNPRPASATITRRIVQDFSASTSVKPLIRAKIQKPLSFIHEPTSEPVPMARAK
jgi:hypothetical protein